MAGLCGACQTAFHERRNCEILFPLQETRQTYLCDFGSSNSDAKVRNKTAEYKLNDMQFPETDWWTVLCSFTMWLGIVTIGVSAACKGTLSTHCRVQRSRRGISIICFIQLVDVSDAGWEISSGKHSQYDRCQEICDPSIMKMRCDKFCEKLTAEENTCTDIFTVKMILLMTCVIFGCCLVPVLISSKYMQAMMKCSTEPCCNGQVQKVTEPGLREAILENEKDKYQSAEVVVQESKIAKLLKERDIVLTYSASFFNQDMGTSICVETSADMHIHEETNSKIPENVSKTLTDVKERVKDDQVRNLQSNIEGVLNCPNSQEETERLPRYGMEMSGQNEVHAAIFSKTACPVSTEEEEDIEILSKRFDFVEKGVFGGSNEIPVDHYNQIRIEGGKHSKIKIIENSRFQMRQRVGLDTKLYVKEVHAAVFSKTACPVSTEEEEDIEILSKRFDFVEKGVFGGSNEIPVDHYNQIRIEGGKHSKIKIIENSRFQMRQRVGLDTKLYVKGYDYDRFKQGSGLIGERTDSANPPDRALHIPDLAMSKQSGADNKVIIKELISKTFDRINTSYRMPPNHFKDERFRMIAFDETASEIHNKDRVNGLRRFSPITSAGRDHQLDRGSPKYCLGENLKENDAEDDCHVLRQITWLPLNELPVPDIYTCITVHSAAQVILNRIASGERVGAQESMKFEVLRVCTFRNYPSEDKPYRILFSTAGMYYASDRDEVVCYSCGLRKAGWKETDNPIDVHKKITPSCKFLVSNSTVNFPIPELEGSQLVKFKILEDLLDSSERPPTQQTEITGGSHGNFDLNNTQSPQYRYFVPPPKHPQYAVQSVRLVTFKGWPTNIPQTPQIMAECGYYYAGFGDCVRCFHCGIGLRHWTEDDYPWIEHARWSKDCAYLRLIKGEEFIQNVHRAIDQDEEPEDLIPATASGQPADMSQVTPNDDSNQILLTDPAQSVLEMGYQPRTIKKAIDIILRSEGRSGIFAEKIMETIFMLEERSDNLEQEVANITISGASSETELQSQNSSERSHNEATDEHEKHRSEGQSINNNKEATDEHEKHRSEGRSLNNSSTGQNSSSSLTQRNTAKGQASNRNAQRSNEVKAQVQKGTDVKSEEKDHAKSGPSVPSNTVTKNEDAASPKSLLHSSLEEKSKGATGTSSTSRDTCKIKAENQKLKEQTICKVCLDKPVSIVFLPCGHLVTCAECAPAMKKCPICRGIVKGMVKAFMS